MIVLGSFVELNKMRELDERFSGARWAPNFAQSWTPATWAAPLRESGSAIRLRDFGTEEGVIDRYSEYMLELYRGRWDEIRAWLDLVVEREVGLACWCPHTRVAKKQIARFGTYHCHMRVVSEVLIGAGVTWTFSDEDEVMV